MPKILKPDREKALIELRGTYRGHAKVNKREFILPIKIFNRLVTSRCHYCGRAPYRLFRPVRYGNALLYNGIDRKDNDKDYIIENCVSCCSVCNLGKHKMPYQDFMNYLSTLVYYRNSL